MFDYCILTLSLRTTFAPDIDVDSYPPVLQVKSTHNTPIEGCWHWLLKTTGHDFRDVVRSGLHNGIYNPNHELHMYVPTSYWILFILYSIYSQYRNLFKWLWPKILQVSLDAFSEYWNNHRIRSQPDKPNISGTTPRQAFTVPLSFGGQDCRIIVDRQVIDDLRAEIPVSREDSMHWVDDQFSDRVQVAYETIGSPKLCLQSGWAIFSQLLIVLQE